MDTEEKEIYLKTDITIAFSVDREVTIGIPVNMEEQLEIKDGDWIAVRKLTPEEVEEMKLEEKFVRRMP